MKNYFSHDEGARNDPKLIKVLMRLGQAGKGVYWDLIEMLYEQNGYLLLLECESYAFALRTECTAIESLINDFGLFEKDESRFWSASVLRRLSLRKAKSAKASESASKRWNNADAMRTHSESNAIKLKEKKVKESKVNIQQQEKNADAVVDEVDFEIAKRKINDVRTATLKATMFTEQQCMSLKIPTHALSLLINGFFDEQLALAQSKAEINYTGLRAHLKNWLPIQVRRGEESKYHPEYNPQKPIQSMYPGRPAQSSVTFVPTNYVANELT